LAQAAGSRLKLYMGLRTHCSSNVAHRAMMGRPSQEKSPRSLSTRTGCLLDEVAACTDEMEALKGKMGRLREELRKPSSEPEDGAVLEAERQLAEYFSSLGRHASAVTNGVGGAEGGSTKPAPLVESDGVATVDIAIAGSTECTSAGVTAAVPSPCSKSCLGEYLPESYLLDLARRLAPPESPGSANCPASTAGATGAADVFKCPAAVKWRGCVDLEGIRNLGAPAAHCECDMQLLAPQVLELADLAERHGAEIRDLRREFWSKCVAAPDLAALAGENQALAQRACQAAERVAVYRTDSTMLAKALDTDRRWSEELRAERRGLLEKIGGLERSESEAQIAHEAAESEVEVERYRFKERAIGQESKLEALSDRAEAAERRWAAAEAAAARLDAREVEVETHAAAESRAAILDAERRWHSAEELEAKLCEEESRRAAADCAGGVGGAGGAAARRARLNAEAEEARSRVSEVRAAESMLVARLAQSQKRGEETERKAMDVARELVDSSQSIAWLRAELEAQHSMRGELEEAQRRCGWLRQRLQTTQVQCEDLDAGRVGQGNGNAGQPGPTAAEEQLEQLHAGRTRAANEALRAAWEAEARDHRVAREKLEALRKCMQPVQQHLVRLAEAARHWRHGLLRTRRPPPDCLGPLALAGDGDRGGGAIAALEDALPQPPAELALDDEERVPDAARALCVCVEALAGESARQLAEADAERRALGGAENLALQAERLALHRELELLSPSSECVQRPLYGSGLSSSAHGSASSLSPSSPGAPGVLSGNRGTPARWDQQVWHDQECEPTEQSPAVAVSQPQASSYPPVRRVQASRAAAQRAAAAIPVAVAEQQPVWPSSPVPQQRGIAGRGSSSGFVGRSGASTLSSVSLHDQREPHGQGSNTGAGRSSAGTPGGADDPKGSSPHSATEPVPLKEQAGGDGAAGTAPIGATRRLQELQRQVNELSRHPLRPPRRSTGPGGSLYRSDRWPASPEGAPHATAGGSDARPIVRRGPGEVRQIPTGARRGGSTGFNTSIVDDALTGSACDRFDNYSVHGWRHL